LVLENINAPIGKVVPGGTNVVYNPQFGGTVIAAGVNLRLIGGIGSISQPFQYSFQASLGLSGPYPGSIGDVIATPHGVVTAIGTNSIVVSGTITSRTQLPGYTLPTPYNLVITSAARSYVAGTTLASGAGQFTAPAVGSTVTVSLQSTWPTTLPAGSSVFIGGYQYAIQSVNNNVTNEVIVQNVGNTNTETFPPGTSITSNKPGSELPPGRMGAYVDGRNWIALPDGQSFIASDLVGYSSGTKLYNFRDAVLSVSSNTQLIGGGSFKVPGAGQQITAISAIAIMNAALGQGPVQVFTQGAGFSCLAPTDQTTWQSLSSPILPENIIGSGALSQWSTVIDNADIFRRSSDGIRTLLTDQLAFDTWGQVPISREISPILDADDQSLLNFSSAAIFDNRHIETANPVQGPLGVYHDTLTALNFDPESSLRGKQPSVYDGIWKGLNVLQLIREDHTGLAPYFNGVQRLFAVCYNTALETIEIWEILSSAATPVSPITWTFETPIIDFGGKDPKRHQLKKLSDGEIYFDEITATTDSDGNPMGLHVAVSFRPDDAMPWTPWYEFDVPTSPTYQPRVGLGEPPVIEDPTTQRPTRIGYYFQVQIIITGQARFKGARFQAALIPEVEFPQPFQM